MPHCARSNGGTSISCASRRSREPRSGVVRGLAAGGSIGAGAGGGATGCTGGGAGEAGRRRGGGGGGTAGGVSGRGGRGRVGVGGRLRREGAADRERGEDQ